MERLEFAYLFGGATVSAAWANGSSSVIALGIAGMIGLIAGSIIGKLAAR